jgi:zinc transport system permease protein
MKVLWCLSIVFVCSPTLAQEAPSGLKKLPPAFAGDVDFHDDILPIFVRACVECHGPKVQEGGLRFDSDERLRQERKVIVPWNADRSRLLHAVAGHHPKTRMPPNGAPLLADQEVGKLRAWIERGAAVPERNLVTWFMGLWPEETFFSYEFNIYSTLSVLLVALTCGALGSLVVANRMAFFSDALAHCSFAGAAFGLLLGLILRASDESFREWILLIMVGFGIATGLLIAFVQEKSGLPNDTVIGVFFAGAIGLGAIFVKTVGNRKYFNLESFLFGDPLQVRGSEILWLFALLVVTWAFLTANYNTLVFSSFNESLALSRQLRVRLCRYGFIALLGLLVNLCLQIVGVLLVNAMLIVPAATAGNFARNMRHLFWGAILLGVVAGLSGVALSWEVAIDDPLSPPKKLQFGQGGLIVVINVLFFITSMILGPRLKGRVSQVTQPVRPAA